MGWIAVRILGVMSLLCLAACSTGIAPMSSLPVPNSPRVPNMSKAELPYPADYAQSVARRLLSRGEVAEVSAPVRYEPWSITDAVAWSSCLRRADGSLTLVVLEAGKVLGTVAPAPAGACEAEPYSPIERGAV